MAQPVQPLIRIENVDVALEGRVVLSDLQWWLRPGEHWAILGPNGAGKSTFLKLVRGELWPAPGCRGRRVYAFNGKPQTTAVGIQEQIALVSPETQSRYLQQEWTLTALQVIHSGFKAGDYVYQKLTSAQEEAALNVITLVGVQELLSRNVQTLSTGELRKVLIARALVGRPRVLVCDEICDGLDAPSRASLLAVLERLAGQGTQLLYTTHRDEDLMPTLTHRLRLEQGRIVVCEPIAALSSRARGERAPGANANSGANPSVGTQRRLEGRSKIKRHAPVVSPAGGRSRRRSPPIRIAVQGASVYQNHCEVLREVTLEIRAGEHWAVLGPNGSGKTTLLKLLVGDLHPALGGRVRRFELAPRHTIWDVKRRIGWVSPELQSLYREPLRGAEVIASGFFSSVGLIQKVTRAQWRRVSEIVGLLGLEALAERSTLQMSYGEFRKILLARALVHRPELLVCDEPFDGLDSGSRAEIARLLMQVAREGTGLVVVTHHPQDLPECTTHVAALRSGRLLFRGPAERFFGCGRGAQR